MMTENFHSECRVEKKELHILRMPFIWLLGLNNKYILAPFPLSKTLYLLLGNVVPEGMVGKRGSYTFYNIHAYTIAYTRGAQY